jgi:hypothetical protein
VGGWWQSRAGGVEAILERTLPVHTHSDAHRAAGGTCWRRREAANWVRSSPATASEPVRIARCVLLLVNRLSICSCSKHSLHALYSLGSWGGHHSKGGDGDRESAAKVKAHQREPSSSSRIS